MKQKVTSEEKRKLKNSQTKEWAKKNPHKVKEYNEFHRKIRMEKIFTKRKNELDEEIAELIKIEQDMQAKIK